MFLFKRGLRWYVEYFDRFENQSKRISAHTSSKAEAYKFLAEFDRRLSAKAAHDEIIGVRDFSDKYVAYLEVTHSKKYARDAKAAFRSLISFAGDIPLKKLTKRLLETFFLSSFKRAKFNTARNYRTIKAAFTKAVEWSNLEANPLANFKFPKLPHNIPMFVTDDKLKFILPRLKNKTIRDMTEFGFLTGCRQGEILSLDWLNVSLAEEIVRITNFGEFMTKPKKERIIPITTRLRQLLLSRIPEKGPSSGLVFGKRDGTAYSSNYISREFKKAVVDCGLDKRFHFHSLRHGTATELIRKNTPVAVVQKLLGHSNIATTMIYTHVTNDDVRKALQKFDDEPAKSV